VCYQCGKTGHTRPNCLKAFDVHTMTVEEHADFIWHKLAALDVHMTDIEQSEEVEGVTQERSIAESGFTSCDK